MDRQAMRASETQKMLNGVEAYDSGYIGRVVLLSDFSFFPLAKEPKKQLRRMKSGQQGNRTLQVSRFAAPTRSSPE
jgi:hypothetical protein